VVAMTCERPEDSDRPISQWSQRGIADEAMRRGIIPPVSQRSMRRIFKKEADLQPHRVRHWLTPKPDPAFDAKCADICEIYKRCGWSGPDPSHGVDRRDDRHSGIAAHCARAPDGTRQGRTA
jgi:hypothetical protein